MISTNFQIQWSKRILYPTLTQLEDNSVASGGIDHRQVVDIICACASLTSEKEADQRLERSRADSTLSVGESSTVLTPDCAHKLLLCGVLKVR